MEAPVKIKRTAITLAQKVQIILKLNDPSFKQKEIAQEYGLTASAISKIVKKKEGILEEWLRGGNLERKRKREGKNQTIDDALLSWFWMASKEEGPISGPVLMAKAKALADEMGIEFKPTNGWLCRWKNRNNLAYRRVPREKADYLTTSNHRPGLPMLVTPSLYLQDAQHVPEYYGEGTPTQQPEEAEEDSRDQTAEGMEQEEQDAHFYTGKS
ncbi:tigger transposable element-derived protein 3-like [Leucoraja erinacea]|uniref:tigger transposable element-derived protein 3-like n=1 Tax=Leucoraja erinaceus TaxID=7782 RepID=UPI0024577FD2|nr:tigger transposable element-derived protein 3-like [Leucoraja erinacea]